MKKHVMAITYAPKIEPVLDERCTQTIRKGRKVSIGDEILFHGWEGRPYRSKWSWRKRVVVTLAENILVSKHGIQYYDSMAMVIRPTTWNSFWSTSLAILDFIDPPTGEALQDVLFGPKGAPADPVEYQIVRWADKSDE